MSKPFWAYGQQARVAREVGLTAPNLNSILHRSRHVSVKLAYKLQDATGVPAMDWLTNSISKHPAFFGKPARSL